MAKRNLRTIFLTAALSVSAVTGAMPSLTTEARADGEMVVIAATAAAAYEEERQMKMIADTLVEPSDENIAALVRNNIITPQREPFVRESVQEANIPAGTRPEQITQEQIKQVSDLIFDKQRVAIVSSPDTAQAVAKGLPEYLSPYFRQCRDRVSFPVDYQHAREAEKCMEDKHWEMDTKPLMQGLGVAGAVLAGGLAAGAGLSRRKKHKP